MSNPLEAPKTVASILATLINQYSKHPALLTAVYEREKFFASDNAKIAIEQIEQLVLAELKKDSSGQ